MHIMMRTTNLQLVMKVIINVFLNTMKEINWLNG